MYRINSFPAALGYRATKCEAAPEQRLCAKRAMRQERRVPAQHSCIARLVRLKRSRARPGLSPEPGHGRNQGALAAEIPVSGVLVRLGGSTTGLVDPHRHDDVQERAACLEEARTQFVGQLEIHLVVIQSLESI